MKENFWAGNKYGEKLSGKLNGEGNVGGNRRKIGRETIRIGGNMCNFHSPTDMKLERLDIHSSTQLLYVRMYDGKLSARKVKMEVAENSLSETN